MAQIEKGTENESREASEQAENIKEKQYTKDMEGNYSRAFQ